MRSGSGGDDHTFPLLERARAAVARSEVELARKEAAAVRALAAMALARTVRSLADASQPGAVPEAKDE